MLERIRKGTNNIVVKIILWLVALSFVGIGGASFIGGNDGGDIVVFDKADSITMQEFQVAKAKEIDDFQRQNNVNLTEENITELDLSNVVLRRLIQESMMNYLSNYYDFDVSEEFVGNFVKNIPYFKNDKGEFDVNIFKGAFRNSRYRENEYLQVIKQDLIKGVLLDIFRNSFNPPAIMMDNIVSFMAETRVVDLLSVDMYHKSSDYKPKIIAEKELEEFYNEQQELFIVPELRNFDYIKSDQAFLAKKLKITESDLKQFFEENKAEFDGKNYASSKKQVEELLKREKLEELTSELAKNFEEDVSGGLTIEEVSQKYGLKIASASDMSLDAMRSSSETDLVELSDNVFEMIEGELSYPIEVADKNEILLISLKSIIPSRQKSFSEVKPDIQELMQKRELANFNWERLNAMKKNYNPAKINREDLKRKGMKLVSNKSFVRDEIPLQEKLPPALMQSIFAMNKGEFTNLASDDENLYVAYVKQINSNKSKASSIKSTSEEQFSNVFKDMLFQELFVHLTKENNMKIMQAK